MRPKDKGQFTKQERTIKKETIKTKKQNSLKDSQRDRILREADLGTKS